MSNSGDIRPEIIRVTDILEQLEKLNERIAFHQQESGEATMLQQYQEMRKDFVKELNTLLKQYNIEINPTDFAS